MYTVYIKKFEDGSVYIGCTKNFNKRMTQHKSCANIMSNKYSHLPIYIKMNECSYTDEILVDNISNLEEAIRIETELTMEYRNNNFNVLNIKDGNTAKGEANGMYGKNHTEESKKKMSESTKGMYKGENNPMYGKHHTEETKKKIGDMFRGEKSFKSYPIEWYETHASRRDKFKRTCERRGWNFEDFDEISSNEIYTSPCGTVVKKYFYKLKNK